jgi:hypothetical protein
MWEKIKLWTRVVVFGALSLYVLIVLAVNWELRLDGTLQLMFISFAKPRVLSVLLVTAVVSVFGWWLLRAVVKTARQFQTVRERSRTAQLEKEMAEMRAKAGMLQKKEAGAGAPGFPVIPVTPTGSSGTAAASVSPADEDVF